MKLMIGWSRRGTNNRDRTWVECRNEEANISLTNVTAVLSEMLDIIPQMSAVNGFFDATN